MAHPDEEERFCAPQDGMVYVSLAAYRLGEEAAPSWGRLDDVLEKTHVTLNEAGCGRVSTSDGGLGLIDAPGVLYGRDDPGWIDLGGAVQFQTLTSELARFIFDFAVAGDLIIAVGRPDRPAELAALTTATQLADLPRGEYPHVQVASSAEELFELLRQAKPAFSGG